MIAVVQDLRPTVASGSGLPFNACAEVWRRVRRVPPWERHRLLAELEPGSIRGLWKASMARYVLDDARWALYGSERVGWVGGGRCRVRPSDTYGMNRYAMRSL